MTLFWRKRVRSLWVVIFVAASLVGQGVLAPILSPAAQTNRKEVKMANDKAEDSIIHRSSHILVIRVEISRAGNWESDENGNPRRFVNLTIRLMEILKGRLRETQGSQIQLRVSQTGRPGTRYYAVPGVWSDQTIDPGTQLVAFSRSSQTQTALLLVEPALQQLLRPEECLLDVRLAMQGESQSLPLPQLLRIAEPNATSLDYIFAEYLAAVHSDRLLGSLSDFSALMSFMENPALSMSARSTLVKFVSSTLLAADPAPNRFLARGVLMMMRQLAMPEA